MFKQMLHRLVVNVIQKHPQLYGLDGVTDIHCTSINATTNS